MVELDTVDEDMLKGKYGEAAARAMELIVSIAEALDAKRLVSVSSVHVSGVSVSNIGEAGVELIESFASNGLVRVKIATVNPIGFDVYGVIPRDEYEWRLQVRVLKALAKMGFRNILSCTPYDYGNRPGVGEHIAWAESSAVAYANSVLGAYTNREGGIVALAAAITGRIYEWGLHTWEGRKPGIKVKLATPIRDDLTGGLLGALIARYTESIPILQGEVRGDELLLRNLLASAAAWGSHALIYIPGVTPDYKRAAKLEPGASIVFGIRDLRNVLDEIGLADENVDAIFIGCPHVAPSTVREIILHMNKCGKARIPVYISTCACVDKDLVTMARRLNVYILAGTCPIVTNASKLGIARLATNSLKAAFYLPRRHRVEVRLGSLEALLRLACEAKS